MKVPVEGGQSVILCDFCLSRIMEAQQQGADLTMTILYQWARECGDIPKLPDSLKLDCMNRCHIVQFVNQQLLEVRTTNIHFPKILMVPDQRERFIQILEKDEDTVRSILNNGWGNSERISIALRLWSGCLCAAKMVVYLSKGIDDLESQVVFLLAILSNYMSDTINIIPNNWQYVP